MNPCVAKEYIESCLKIRTKSGAVVPFRLNAAQQKLYAVAKRQQDAGKPVRLIILKARQLGFSTLTEALLFHACASRGALPGLRSRFRCATAGGRGIGRSDTLQCVHLSEYAFWPEGGESKAATLAGILQAVPSAPGTMVIIESTANGCEDFKERWDAAVAGENDFEPVFFAWFENPDYTMPVEPGIEWTAEEREVRERYSLSWEQMRWRRWCIANNCGGSRDMFRQEYPANPDEAFLHSGSGVFDNGLVIRRREEAASPVHRGRFVLDESGEAAWLDDDAGEICIYRERELGHPYVLGGDTAGEGSDWFTAHVIDNSTGEQVASLRRRFSEPEYVRQVYALGKYYNDALVALETNFSTYPVMKLAELGYPNQYRREREDTYTHRLRASFGFRTDRQTRPRAIANLVEVFSLHPEWFSDRELLGEMLTFCYNEDYRPEALAGKHDDLVMAAAICYAARHQQRMTTLSPGESREDAAQRRERQRRIRRGRI